LVIEPGLAPKLMWVITYILFFALAIIARGVYVFTSGILVPPLPRGSRSGRMLRPAQRIGLGGLHVGIGLAMVAVLVQSAVRRQVPHLTVREWIAAHLGFLTQICFASCVAIWGIVRPSDFVKWVQDTHPQTSLEGKFVVPSVRVLAAVMLGMALFMLASILWSPAIPR